MVVTTPTRVFDAHGQPLQLGARLGRGGEGGVYEVIGKSDLVAKLYHHQLSSEQQKKVVTLSQLKTERLLKIAAWPAETLHASPGTQVIGFLMPKVAGYKEIHELQGPKSRLSKFPEHANWRFLVHVATNTARAFAVLHDHGHVMGDVNDRNIFVSHDGKVKLLDCDSYQVTYQGVTFPCSVGVPEYTPPEFQGRSLRGLVRSQNHDAFGLAVLIFQLLFMGRHPFTGIYTGVGEKQTPEAIKEFRFVYASDADRRQMRRPPGAPPASIVPTAIARLFDRAFTEAGIQKGGRPSAQEWVTELSSLSSKLTSCSDNPSHEYYRGLASCPWCALQRQTGVIFFAAVAKPVPTATPTSVNPALPSIAAIWAQIQAVPVPPPLPPLPLKTSFVLAPSADVSALVSQRITRQNRVVITGMLVFGTAWLLPLSVTLQALLAAVILVAAVVVYRSWSTVGVEEKRRELTAKWSEVTEKWEELTREWNSLQPAPFHAKRSELDKLKHELDSLGMARQQKIKAAIEARRKAQLQSFLDRHRIDRASIPGIGPTRVSALRSFGIETASDISARAVSQVPGFGPSLTQTLVDWRQKVEQSYFYVSVTQLSPQELGAIDQEIETVRIKLEQGLKQGLVDLRLMQKRIEEDRPKLEPQLAPTLREVVQLEVDLAAL